MRFLLLAFALTSFAHASTIQEQLAQLDGRSGDFQVFVNGKENEYHRGNCSIRFDAEYNQLTIENSLSDVFVSIDSLKPAGVNTYRTDSTGRRVGGDACGDFGGMSGYKQTLTLKGNVLQVRTQFRCWMVEKNDLIDSCTLH
jgi:hypothetical protein